MELTLNLDCKITINQNLILVEVTAVTLSVDISAVLTLRKNRQNTYTMALSELSLDLGPADLVVLKLGLQLLHPLHQDVVLLLGVVETLPGGVQSFLQHPPVLLAAGESTLELRHAVLQLADGGVAVRQRHVERLDLVLVVVTFLFRLGQGQVHAVHGQLKGLGFGLEVLDLFVETFNTVLKNLEEGEGPCKSLETHTGRWN